MEVAKHAHEAGMDAIAVGVDGSRPFAIRARAVGNLDEHDVDTRALFQAARVAVGPRTSPQCMNRAVGSCPAG